MEMRNREPHREAERDATKTDVPDEKTSEAHRPPHERAKLSTGAAIMLHLYVSRS